MKNFRQRILAMLVATVLVMVSGICSSVLAAAPPVTTSLPGGTLDPNNVPKYVTPLVIPPVMPKVSAPIGTPGTEDYDIAVRQFRQQILPGGIWNTAGGYAAGTYTYPATTVWSYGRAQDPMPDSTALGGGAGIAPAPNSSFNYPAFTVENISGQMTKVRWINELVQDPVACFHGTPSDAACSYLSHLLPVDQTLHWANPNNSDCFHMGMTHPGTDCETLNQQPYLGPVPIVTHVHGAHVNPESDGYPEAWFLPNARNIPGIYAMTGSNFGQWTGDGANNVAGSAFYAYENTQPATTIWYHDHSMGMTRLNVYAGPAGFWLIRGGANDTAAGVLPGPAPVAADAVVPLNVVGNAKRNSIREIPLAIQDRSFDWVDAAGNPVPEGSPTAVGTKLWYPTSRIDFDGFDGPYLGDPAGSPADISKIWNPEAFFNTMVVNGVTWPKLNVAQERYRFRLLNGCNSRTLNLSMFIVDAGGNLTTEIPFFQIGGDQGFLPAVTMIKTGVITALTPGQPLPNVTPTPGDMQAMLLMPGERADVIVDFAGLPAGTRVRIINTAGDAPFGGLDPLGVADANTTGQVMEFVVDASVNKAGGDTSTPVTALVLPAEAGLGAATGTRQVSLNELGSDTTCVAVDAATGDFVQFLYADPANLFDLNACIAAGQAVGAGITGDLAGPRQALLGTIQSTVDGLVAVPQRWMDPVSQSVLGGSTEVWEVFNTTMDAHPIHVHLVRFEVVNREDVTFDMMTGAMTLTGTISGPRANELGFKDTVVAYPGQVTRLKAKFDIAGRYVWHCHIVEHEDNEMMLPFDVGVVAPASITVPATSTTGTYVVSWAASTTAGATYVLEESTTATFDAGTVTEVLDRITPTSATISFKSYGTYYYRVKAVKPPLVESGWVASPTPIVVSAANVALTANGGLASASTIYSGKYPASAVNNGDRKGLPFGNGGIYADNTARAYPDWVQVAFQGVKSIDEIDVFGMQDNFSAPVDPTPTMTFTKYGLTNFDVQYWNGTMWVTVPGGSITNNNLVWKKITFPAITTDSIRVFVNGAKEVYSYIAEIEAYEASTTRPAVTITSPVVGASFTEPAQVDVIANATPVGTRTINKVEFYNGAVLLGTSTTGPNYTYNWINVPAGSYSVTAVAYDDANDTGTSDPLVVNVASTVVPTINVALTANGGTASASTIYSGKYPASAINNGDRKGLRFGIDGVYADSTARAYPDWVQIAFSVPRTITEVDVFGMQDSFKTPVDPTPAMTFTKYGLTSFDVQYWDGTIWVTVPGGNITNNNLVWNKITFSPITTDSVRISVNSAKEVYSYISEVEVWGQ